MKVDIIDMTHEGKGVGRTKDGLTLFVEGGLVGDRVEVEITKKKKRFAEARVKDIVEKSPYRVESNCRVSSDCGGCDFQELDYNKQLELKEKRVRDALRKIGKLDIEVEDIIHGDNIHDYRNKVIFHVDSKKSSKIGFYKKKSHDIVSARDCNISSKISVDLIPLIEDFIGENNIKSIVDIMVRQSKKSGDTMVVLITDKEDIQNMTRLADLIVDKFPQVKTLIQNIKNKNTKGLLGKKNIVLCGQGYIYEYIGDLKYKISPETFFQVNTEGMELLYNKVLEYMDLRGDEKVYDIYCGVGSISLLLAKEAKEVYGIELVEKSIKNARENASENGITNVEFFTGPAEKLLPELNEKGYIADKVVLDPPRKGCDKAVLDSIADIDVKSIVYVSCDPSTMARDIEYLSQYGYKAQKVQPVDMFPMTGHTESVALLTK